MLSQGTVRSPCLGEEGRTNWSLQGPCPRSPSQIPLEPWPLPLPAVFYKAPALMASLAELGGLGGKKDRGSSCKGQQPLGPGTSMMQMWNLHSQCPLASQPACPSVC